MSAQARDAAKSAAEQTEADELAYDRYRRSEGARIFAELSPDEQAEIRNAAAEKSRSAPVMLRTQMAEHYIPWLTADHHPQKIKTFKAWRTSRAAS